MTRFCTPSPLFFTALIISLHAVVIQTNSAREFSNRPETSETQDIGQSVYTLDILADQMSFRYEWELRYNRGCKDSLALFKHIKKHVGLTNDLVRAYRSKCSASFKTASSAVLESVRQIETLRKQARVSVGVTKLINQSVPLANEINPGTNTSQPSSTVNLNSLNDTYRRRG